MSPSLKVAIAVVGLMVLLLAGLQSAEAQSPLYNNIPPVKQVVPTPSPSFSDIDLSNVPPANSVGDANANNKFSARAAAAIYAVSGIGEQDSGANLSTLSGENYGLAILAMWAYQDYFNVPDGDTHHSNTFKSLLEQVAGSTGTPGDYDFVINLYIPLIYKYYNDLPFNVREHIINVLLNLRGPLTSHESEYYFNRTFGTYIPETENHLFLIETARYLTNQILYQRTHDPQYDNRRNGGDDLQATVVWLLYALQGILQHDFLEYNARPYQDNIMMALLNLESYAYDDDVRLAARMVLDYISAKVAVSSNDLRRAPPFRRRNEERHWGPTIQGTFALRSPLLIPKGDYHNPDRPDPDKPTESEVFEPDVQGTWYAMLAGNTELLTKNPVPSGGPGGFGLAMVFAGVHDYRVPDLILDLFVNRKDRLFYQRFQHIHTDPDAGFRAIADEIYAGSPSYLLTAGGHPTDYCYRPIILHKALWGVTPDWGSAMPTTFMPTGSGLTLDTMIQFGSYTDSITDNDSVKFHMGVAPDFACGTNVFPTDAINNAVSNDRQGPWTFLNRGQSGEQPGYYVALYDGFIYGDYFGLLEAYDTWLHPGLSFDQFKSNVLAKYGSTRFSGSELNTYVTQSGQRVEFYISPVSEIASSSWLLPPFAGQFAYGNVINSAQGSGVITISNPALPGKPQITLDMHDVFHPTRTSELGEIERAGWDVHEEVWVDFNSPVSVGPDGDFYHPFKTMAEAQNKVAVGGTIKIVPGSTNEPIVLTKKMIVKSFPDSAIIGQNMTRSFHEFHPSSHGASQSPDRHTFYENLTDRIGTPPTPRGAPVRPPLLPAPR